MMKAAAIEHGCGKRRVPSDRMAQIVILQRQRADAFAGRGKDRIA
jgi:hypothetical protein